MREGRLPPLNAVRAFHAAAVRLNFRLAAEDLGVTQSAVAQQVRGLEAYLSTRLFERRSRGLDLSRAGEAFFSAVDRAFRLLEEAASRTADAPDVLTLSAPPTFVSRWLVPRLHNFTRIHPTIEVRLSASERLANFGSDGVDVAVRYGSGRYPHLATELLFEADPVAACTPNLIARFGRFGPKEVGTKVPLLSDSHRLWARWFPDADRRGPELERGIAFSHTQHAIEAALLDQGVALVPRRFVEAELASGRLVQPFALDIDLDIGFYVVAPEETWNAGKVLGMRSWLATEAVRNEPPRINRRPRQRIAAVPRLQA